MISIIETWPGDAFFPQFFELPTSLYPADSPKFVSSENIPTEFLETHYLILDEGKAVARASLYKNPSLFYREQPVCTVGNYECADEGPYAEMLLKRLSNEAKARGAGYLIGPMNGSSWESHRLATDHVQPPFFLEPYHHLYYNVQFQKAGFIPVAEYHTNIDANLYFDRPDILEREQELRKAGVTIRPIDVDNFEKELERIHHFNSTAFSKNFLFTPISLEVFLEKYLPTKAILNPEFTLIAEDKNHDLIGYYFCLDDRLNTARKSLIAKTLARHPDPKWRGLGHVIGNMVVKKAVAQGYEIMLHPFMYSHGTSPTLSSSFSGDLYRKYHLYGKKI